MPLPVLTVAAGSLFGGPLGFALASLSSLISAGGVFLAGRYLSRKWLLGKITSSKKIQVLDDAVTDEGWKMVFLLRLTSILPFSVLNYGLGLSKIRFRHYLFATWAGMLTPILLYTYLGTLTGKAVFGKGERQTTFIEWVFFAAGLVITFGMTLYAASIVKKALQTHEHSNPH